MTIADPPPPGTKFEIPPWPHEEEKEIEPEVPNLSMEELLMPQAEFDIKEVGISSLAYIGDSVFELFVRTKNIWPHRRTSIIQETVVATVRARHQAKLLARLLQKFPISNEEDVLIKRGIRNQSVKGNKRKTVDYSNATGLETLIGYLYLTDKERCSEVMNWLYANLETDLEEYQPPEVLRRGSYPTKINFKKKPLR
eukprot:CAMPEP_0116853390 /NCGR_PEP_ID=MMETSP0418-20121206/17885_1 /TAXON_ID=1158023 /ORGANISM="Astrosyne radiata, Strain 13vi08-1A" /LENGTH=196 /DNA_ID=CAMNT_0004485785 /DNA_START=196 /DNA_END=786 /DNA_ORIENTATION=+